MNIFGFQITRTPASAPTPPDAQRSFSPGALAWLQSSDPDSGPVLTNAFQQVVWVHRAVSVLAEQVANIPFLFSAGPRGHENLITSGPLLDLYSSPHPQISRFQYWELRVIWLMLRGECVRIPVFDDPGPRSRRTLTRILILDPASFQHIVRNHELVGWRYTGAPRSTPLPSQVFLPEEVWFEKLPNPFDFWRGMPPLHAAALAAKTDFAASSFMKGLIENNADLGVIVRTDSQLDPHQREQLLAALRERKRRAGTADRPLLLWSGAEIIKPQISSADLQFLENRKFSRAEICAAFGVPEEILTTTDNAKYDVMAASRLNFIENRVAPLCARFEAEEQATVKTIDPQATGWFDLDALPIMQEARRSRLAAAKIGFDMGIPFNALNRAFDLGFPSLPWGDQGFLPASLHSQGSASTQGRASLPEPSQKPGPSR